MNALQRQTEGYSEDFLESMLRRTTFPSPFFDQPVRVRGVCFSAGPDSSRLAREFAEGRLALGTVSMPAEAVPAKAWQGLVKFFTHPQTRATKVGFLLQHLDQASKQVQEKVAAAILASETLLWFAAVNDHQKLVLALKMPFLVYLGLGPSGRMQMLIQPGQRLLIDKGSFRKGPRPALN
jgi:hypothetical protein